eukprot:6435742-Amphidinium_carterae.1
MDSKVHRIVGTEGRLSSIVGNNSLAESDFTDTLFDRPSRLVLYKISRRYTCAVTFAACSSNKTNYLHRFRGFN